MCLAHSAQSAPGNRKLLLDMVQNNPGDAMGFQESKYTDSATQKGLGFTGVVTTGENSISLAVNYSSVLPGGWVFPEGSPRTAWLTEYQTMLRDWSSGVTSNGLGTFFFTDLLVLPKAITENATYTDQVMTNGLIDFNKPLTKQLMIAQFTEMFALYPATEGIVVRTGETYVYENPFHVGNSPIKTAGPTKTEQQKAWADFITFLRDEVCVKLGKTVLFRTWDNFDGWTSSSEYYLAVMSQVAPHDNLYISIKHTAGDFYRNMAFNHQLGVGEHAQIVEVECQREYEGKGAFPNYVMNGVINGFSEMSTKMGLQNLIPSNPLVKGVWTWSRGGGWWGPYIKGNELWIDLHVATVSKWFTEDGAVSEKDIFKQHACPYALPGAGGPNSHGCDLLYNISLLSAEAMLYSHYCPEVAGKCWGWTRDDRLGGLSQVGGAFKAILDEKKVNESLANKALSVKLWGEISAISKTLHAIVMASNDTKNGLFLKNSVMYGKTFAEIIESGWKIMLLGTEGGHDDEVAAEIERYDMLWSVYLSYRLVTKAMPSLYHGYYFNLPVAAPTDYANPTIAEFGDRWASPEDGMHKSVNQFRKKN